MPVKEYADLGNAQQALELLDERHFLLRAELIPTVPS